MKESHRLVVGRSSRRAPGSDALPLGILVPGADGRTFCSMRISPERPRRGRQDRIPEEVRLTAMHDPVVEGIVTAQIIAVAPSRTDERVVYVMKDGGSARAEERS